MKTAQPIDNRERVLLVGVGLKKAPRGRAGDPTSSGRDSLEELQELAESAGAKIEASILQVRVAVSWTKSASKRKCATSRL
jgi:50S ribosomal subunit-associated GTPase HflX